MTTSGAERPNEGTRRSVLTRGQDGGDRTERPNEGTGLSQTARAQILT